MDHGGQCAFHVGRTATIHAPINNFSAKGIVLPVHAGSHANGIAMGIEQQRGTGLATINNADQAAIFVVGNFIEAEATHLLTGYLDSRLFFARQCLHSNKRL